MTDTTPIPEGARDDAIRRLTKLRDDPADAPAAPPVAAGGQDTPSERTGPLGLSEAETRYWNARERVYAGPWAEGCRVLQAACRAAVAEWDAEPQPAETLADIASTVVEYGGGRYTLSDYWCAPANGPLNAEWRDKPHRLLYDLLREIERLHFEAATRPDPDTITVNRDDLAEALCPAAGVPPVAAGERTGPLGLSEEYPELALLETRERVREVARITDDELDAWQITAIRNLVEACRAAVAEWDADTTPPPNPDTITVNLDVETVRYYAADTFTADDDLRAASREALAAAGLPQEPTDTRSRPTREEQRAHLDEGSCRCHDSWDQCPCAEGGHPTDGSCNCCPLGTGLCGPRPQEPTEGGDQ